jgi:DNA-binding beta-propeller fold protein YncE
VGSVSGLAADSATGVVYAANTNAGTVTSFGELNGTLLHSAVVANVLAGSFPFALALDAANATLFVSISTRFAGAGAAAPSGWVVALDTATLSVRANYSFPGYPTPPFEPSFLAFDGPTHQLFVENASGGTVGAVDVMAGTVRTYISCGVMECADHGYGLLDIPSLHDLVIPTCQPQIVVVSTLNDTVDATITGSSTTIMAWSAFDSRSGMLWVENYTFNRSNGTLLKVNLTTNRIVADVPGIEPREASMVYDPLANALVTSDVNGSEQISTYNATTGSRIASFAGSPGSAHPFKTLAVDIPSGVVIAGGPGNGTTSSFSLPSLAPMRTYSPFPATLASVAVDPAAGMELMLGASPNELVGVNETNGAVIFTTPLSSKADPTSVAVDPTDGRAYVGESGTGTIGIYDTRNGSASGSVATGSPFPGMLLSIDATHQLLYYAGPSATTIGVVGLASGRLLGSIPVPGVAVCALAADPAAGTAFAANCGGVGNVTRVSGLTLGRLGVTAVAPNPSALTLNATGSLFVLDGTGGHVSILNSTGASAPAGVVLPSPRSTLLAVDDRDGLLVTGGGASPTLSVFALSNRSFAGTVALPAPTGAIAFDPAHGRFVAPELYTGADDLVQVLAAPSAPGGVYASGANQTLRITWAAPVSSGASPVMSYQVAVTDPQGGPVSTTTASGVSLGVAVGNLTDGTPYVVRVSATSADGTGPSSSPVTGSPVGVPYPPTNLTAGPTGSTTVALQWLPPLVDDGGPVTGYWVNVSGGPGARLIFLGNVTQLTVDGLAGGHSYTFTLRAVNAGGPGNSGIPAGATTPPAPLPFVLDIGAGVLVAAGAVALVLLLRRRRRSRAADPQEADA